MVTIGGYGNSEGEPSETSAYRDAQAALDWVKAEHNIESASVLAHGLSIGGAVAASLARDNPGLHLTLDQTFVNAYEVARCVAANRFEGYAPEWAVAAVVGTSFPTGLVDGPYVTDGFDTEAKLRSVEGHVFCFTSTKVRVHTLVQ